MTLPTDEEVTAQLLAPGGIFELTRTTIAGEEMDTFVHQGSCLRDLVANSAGFGDAPYLIMGDRRYTFAEHAEAVASVAQALHTRFGVGPGDRVGILAANCPEWVITFWATVSLGAVAVGLNGWWAGDEIRFAVDHTRPKVLIADRKRLDRVGGGGDLGVAVVTVESDFADLLAHAGDPHGGVEAPVSLPDQPIDPDDAALILFTSGTTGRSKGAVQSHRNIMAFLMISFFQGARTSMRLGIAPGSTVTRPFITNPLFHVSGLHNGAIVALAAGLTTVWNVGRFEPAEAMAAMQREGCTSWAAVPTLAWRLVNDPRVGDFDLSAFTNVGFGGAATSESLQERVREVFPNAADNLGLGYGLTEFTSLATVAAGEDLVNHPGTVGKALPTVQIEIRDADGQPVPDGEEGEIHLRGPEVMVGYWNDPEATAAAIGPGRWLRTGDLGVVRDGFLFIVSRRTDLIIRAGENIYPAEIELALEAHPDVAEVCVLGADHEELGQTVVAVVVPTPGADPAPEDLAGWLGERIAAYKVPVRWEFRSVALPRTATGKVLRGVVSGARASGSFIED